MVVLAHIKEQSRLNLDSDGRPRITDALKALGLPHAFNIAPNLLNRDFHADGHSQKWAGDISYVWTRESWLYLTVILDLHSRRVIGWSVSYQMKRDLALRALNMAVALRQPPKGCIHQTDRGSQYCSNDYQKLLRKHGFKMSMSSKGNCYDNSAPSRQHALHPTAGQCSRCSAKRLTQS